MVGKAQKSDGARSEVNSVFGLENVNRLNPLEHQAYSTDLTPCDFWAFLTMKRELRAKKFRTDACSTFSRSGRSVVRSASLAKGSTS
jgi:hypothetical protein